ncbi:uncharacterized protein LOC132126996 [Carassius carassius]|uniref:uncharacterized protein LOC132126996 n=1 Tax=Carassius carassius TaxID=217509 RepID=UPI0028684903|nr:uncharacterized protein LOC132126996 [Carassius carassius]
MAQDGFSPDWAYVRTCWDLNLDPWPQMPGGKSERERERLERDEGSSEPDEDVLSQKLSPYTQPHPPSLSSPQGPGGANSGPYAYFLWWLRTSYQTLQSARNVYYLRTAEGEIVSLPCHSPPKDSVQVSVEWTKHNESSTTICKWSIKNNTGSIIGECIPRFKFNTKSFTLSIENVQFSDSGTYSCKITRVIPPPSIDDTTNLTLQVAPCPDLQKLNSSNDSCIHLLCSMEGLTSELVNFTWSREGHGSLHPFTSNAMNSELRLCKPDWSDGDKVTCYANYSSTQTQRSIQLTSQKDSYRGGP